MQIIIEGITHAYTVVAWQYHVVSDQQSCCTLVQIITWMSDSLGAGKPSGYVTSLLLNTMVRLPVKTIAVGKYIPKTMSATKSKLYLSMLVNYQSKQNFPN